MVTLLEGVSSVHEPGLLGRSWKEVDSIPVFRSQDLPVQPGSHGSGQSESCPRETSPSLRFLR